MAHYAFLDQNNIVTEVIVGKNEGEDGIDWEEWYGNFRGQKCLRTSYNHNIRKHFAGIGFEYHEDLDAFVPPKMYPSWILNPETALYEAPIPMPQDSNSYTWNEDNQSWDQIELATPNS